jgi:hypothetical protein
MDMFVSLDDVFQMESFPEMSNLPLMSRLSERLHLICAVNGIWLGFVQEWIHFSGLCMIK